MDGINVDQMEQALRFAFQQALKEPELAELRLLWQRIEAVLSCLPEAEQLRLAGTAIVSLAEIYSARSNRLLKELEEGENQEGPVVSDDLLAGLVQRTMHLDISDLTRKPKPSSRKKQPPTGSMAGVVDKSAILKFVEAHEAIEKAKALAVAHDEDVTAWAQAIDLYMTQTETTVRLSQLHQALQERNPQMSLIKVWLALLLRGYGLEQRGDFYKTETVWVTRQVER